MANKFKKGDRVVRTEGRFAGHCGEVLEDDDTPYVNWDVSTRETGRLEVEGKTYPNVGAEDEIHLELESTDNSTGVLHEGNINTTINNTTAGSPPDRGVSWTAGTTTAGSTTDDVRSRYYFFPEEMGQLTEINKPKMRKVTNTFKLFTDKKTQDLYKAGYINGDLEPTEQGLNALNSLLLAEYKDKLVELAREELKEENNK